MIATRMRPELERKLSAFGERWDAGLEAWVELCAEAEPAERMALLATLSARWVEAILAWQSLCATEGDHELALVLLADDAHRALRAAIPHRPKPEDAP